MVDAVSIQEKVNKGFGKAAQKLGDSYNWYRPAAGAGAPIVSGNLQGTILAQFANDKGLQFTSPSTFKTAETWYGFTNNMDNLLAGDYFVGEMGTLFVTDIERFVSLHCVWCNRTISIGRASSTLSPGSSTNYSGQAVVDTAPVLTNWPVSLRLPGMRTRDPKMKLPSDAQTSLYMALLPPSATPEILWNDIVTDDLGQRYVVNAIEQSPLGSRLMLDMWPPG